MRFVNDLRFMSGALIKFDAAAKERCCRALARTGAPTKAAKAAGVSFSTMSRHLRSDPEFRDAYDRALAEHRDMLYAEAVHRATVGYHDGSRLKKSDAILLRLLQRHDPGFRDRLEVDQTTEVRVAPRAQVAKLADDELAQLEALLAKAEPE